MWFGADCVGEVMQKPERGVAVIYNLLAGVGMNVSVQRGEWKMPVTAGSRQS